MARNRRILKLGTNHHMIWLTRLCYLAFLPLLRKPNGIVASNHALVMMNYLFGFKGKQKRKQIRPMSNTHV